MKKKIIAVSFVVTFALVLGVVLNPKEVKGDGDECAVVVTEDRNLAFDASAYQGQMDTSYTTNYDYNSAFSAYGATVDNVSCGAWHASTAEEMNGYLNNLNERMNSDVDVGDTYYDSNYNHSTNSGSNNGLSDVEQGFYDGVVNGLGGGSIEDGANSFVNGGYNNATENTHTDSTYNGVVSGGNYSQTLTTESNAGDGIAIGGMKYMVQSRQCTITMSVGEGSGCPGDEEDEDDEEQPDCGPPSADMSISSGCAPSASSGATISVSETAQKEEPSEDAMVKLHCPTMNNIIKAAGNANINESGHASFTLEPTTQFAGGGVRFSVSYSASASVELCGGTKNTNPKVERFNIQASCDATGYDSCTLSSTQSGICSCTYTDTVTESSSQYSQEECVCPTCSYSNGICYWEESTTVSKDVSVAKCDTYATLPATTEDKEWGRNAILAAARKHINKSVSSPTVTAPHSNDVVVGAPDTGVSLTSDVTNQGIAGTSSGGGSYFSFSLNRACINKYDPFNVVYIDANKSCDTLEQKDYVVGYIDGGVRYYIPLKYPDTDSSKVKFTFNASSGNISIVDNISGSLSYSCGVNVEQKIYNTPSSSGGSSGGSGGSGTGSGGYKFVYRPIDLSNPFPNRDPSSNWTAFVNTSLKKGGSGAYDKYMKRDITEYSTTLTASTIEKIKTMNDTEIQKNSNYNSLNTISLSGKSQLLSDIIGKDRKSNYNKLGECNREVTTIVDGIKISSSILEGTECW